MGQTAHDNAFLRLNTLARLCDTGLMSCTFAGLSELPTSLRWAISKYQGHDQNKRADGCEAVLGQKGNLALSSDSTLMFLHTRGNMMASWPHIGAAKGPTTWSNFYVVRSGFS